MGATGSFWPCSTGFTSLTAGAVATGTTLLATRGATALVLLTLALVPGQAATGATAVLLGDGLTVDAVGTSRILLIHEDEVELLFNQVGACHLDGYGVAQTIDLAATATTDAVVLLRCSPRRRHPGAGP